MALCSCRFALYQPEDMIDVIADRDTVSNIGASSTSSCPSEDLQQTGLSFTACPSGVDGHTRAKTRQSSTAP